MYASNSCAPKKQIKELELINEITEVNLAIYKFNRLKLLPKGSVIKLSNDIPHFRTRFSVGNSTL